jgi:hypothetical protein
MSNNEVKANLMLPAVTGFIGDVESRWGMLGGARENGLSTGLMLVQKPESLDSNSVDRQIQSLKKILENEAQVSLMIHHPNMPVENYNWLINPNEAMESVKQSVELAKRLKGEFDLEEVKVLFHLNSLMLPEQWGELKDREEKMWEKLEELVSFTNDVGVKLAVETTPVPEFGDMERNEESKIVFKGGQEVHLADLTNPFPLLPWRENIQRLRDMGFSLAIDFCHTDIAIRAISEIGDLPEKKQELARQRYLVSKEDVKKAKEYLEKGFKEVVQAMTEDGDIWQANNDSGLYKEETIHGDVAYFQEGVVLAEDEGDIAIEQITPLLLAGLQMAIDIVLEIDETDFNNSPNTRRSLEWFLSLLDIIN